MRFSDVFPLTTELLPAGPWKQPRNPPYVPAEGETYGLPTGRRNGVWVLDLDKKGDKDGLSALQQYMVEHDLDDLPDTYMVRTKTGGLHVYFTLPAGLVIANRVGVLSGVDVRGENGFVRAGGSLYPVVQDHDPVPAPAWLVTLVAPKAPAAVPVSAVAMGPDHPEWEHRINLAGEYLMDAAPCIQGQGGDAQLWRVALHLIRTLELPIDTCLSMLVSYNHTCVPPWPEADLRRKLTEAATKGVGITGTFPKDFLAPPAPLARTVPAGPVSTWRQRKNPQHEYSFDLAIGIAGSGAANPIQSRDLTAAFTGPGAMPEWVGVWQYDLFARRLMAVNPPLKLNAEDTGFDSTDLINVKMWLQCVKGVKALNAQLEEAIKSAVSAAEFHPVRDYLTELQEDPNPKSAGAAPKSAGGFLKSADTAELLFGSTPEDAPHVVDYLRKWMIGCVARVMVPGAKFDTVLTLLGPGGYLKSTFFKTLSVNSDWYRSNLPDVSEPQKVGLAMRGHWIIELGELTTLRRAHRESFLEFITRTEEKFRSPYEKTEVIERRQCGIGATANNLEFMAAWDGAIQRRFLPVAVNKRIDIAWLEAHLDELWAEAFAAFKAGESWWVDNEDVFRGFKETFTDVGPVEEKVAVFLESNANRALVDGKSATEAFEIIMCDPQRKTIPTNAQRLELAKQFKNSPGITARRNTTKRYYSVRPIGPEGAVAERGVPTAKSAGEDPNPKSAGNFFAQKT